MDSLIDFIVPIYYFYSDLVKERIVQLLTTSQHPALLNEKSRFQCHYYCSFWFRKFKEEIIINLVLRLDFIYKLNEYTYIKYLINVLVLYI